jgi:hypothetical protein
MYVVGMTDLGRHPALIATGVLQGHRPTPNREICALPPPRATVYFACRFGVPRALPADDYGMRSIVTTAADYVMARVAM